MVGRRYALGLAAGLVLSGCGILPQAPGTGLDDPPPEYVNVVRTEEVRLQLIPRDPGAPANDHPAAFTPEQLHLLLMSLRVVSEDEGKVTLASPERLQKVAAALGEGLALASPRQDLKLVFFRTKSRGIMFGASRYVTTARVFFRDNTLHFIFGELDRFNSPYRDVSIKPHEPGERDEPTVVNGARLVANGAWRWHQQRRDWIEMGATAAAIAEAADAAPQVISVGESASARPLAYGPAAGIEAAVEKPPAALDDGPAAAQAEPEAGQIPQTEAPPPAETAGAGPDAILAPEPPESPGPTELAPPPSPPPAPAALPAGVPATAGTAAAWAKIEERLTVLRRLREQGLITQQDYEQKKEELLEELP